MSSSFALTKLLSSGLFALALVMVESIATNSYIGTTLLEAPLTLTNFHSHGSTNGRMLGVQLRGPEAAEGVAVIQPATGEVLGDSTSTVPASAAPALQTDTSYIASEIQNVFQSYLKQGLLTGPTGPQGTQGNPGPAGAAAVVNNQNGNTTALIDSTPIVTYVPPVPSDDFAGTTIAGFGQLSANALSVQSAIVAGLLTGGSLTVSGAASLGTTTVTGLTSNGNINFTGNLYQNGVLFSSGTSSQWTTLGSNIYYNTGSISIGTTSPSQLLTVGNNNQFTVSSIGNVNVATLTTSSLVMTDSGKNLHSVILGTGLSFVGFTLNASGSFSGSGTNGQVPYFTSGSNITSASDLLNNGTVAGINATSSATNFLVQGTGSNNPFQVNSSTGASLLTVLANGDVGLGSTVLAAGSNSFLMGTTTAPSGTAGPGLYIQGDSTHFMWLMSGPNDLIELHEPNAFGMSLYNHNDVDYKAPYINLFKSRGTYQAPTAVRYTGYEIDSLGGINFGGYDGVSYNTGAAMYSQTDDNWTATNTPAHLGIYFTPEGLTHPNQIMQFGGDDAQGIYGYDMIAGAPINWTGNGSGDTQINGGVFGYEGVVRISRGDGSGGAVLSVDNIGVGTLAPSSYFDLYSPNNGNLPLLRLSSVLSNATTTRFVVTSIGNVGIGTISPASSLFIQAASSVNPFTIASSTGASVFVVNQAGNITASNYPNCSGFTSNSNGLIQCTASDQRLKQNITPLPNGNGLAAINALNPVSFYWLDPTRGTTEQFGLIAQQVQQIFPNLVSTTTATSLTPGGTLTLNYDGLISALVLATQELSASSTTMQNSLQVLQNQISNLQSSFGSSASSSELAVYVPSDFSGDSVGQAEILAGQTSVSVTFSQAYFAQPIVTADVLDTPIEHDISNITASGFTIAIPDATSTDITFDWHSFASPQEKLFVSDGSSHAISLGVANSNRDADTAQIVIENPEAQTTSPTVEALGAATSTPIAPNDSTGTPQTSINASSSPGIALSAPVTTPTSPGSAPTPATPTPTPTTTPAPTAAPSPTATPVTPPTTVSSAQGAAPNDSNAAAPTPTEASVAPGP